MAKRAAQSPMKLPRVLQVLRLAALALCLLLCAAFTALWVRSYYWLDAVRGHLFNALAFEVGSTHGYLAISKLPNGTDSNWSWTSTSETQIRATLQRTLSQLQNEFATLSEAIRNQLDSGDHQFNEHEIRRRRRQLDAMQGEYELIEARLVGQSVAANGFPTIATRFGFGFQRLVNGWAVAIPHWLPALILAATATTIAVPRMWRFSLRSLLLATTLVAVVLGLLFAAR